MPPPPASATRGPVSDPAKFNRKPLRYIRLHTWVNTPITRPRYRSSTSVCRIPWQLVMKYAWLSPTASSNTNETQNQPLDATPISAQQQALSAYTITFLGVV